MYRTVIALAVAALSVGPTAAAQTTDVMAAVHRFVDSFNKGDTAAVAAVCADETSIIDEFPPYEWHGSGACLTWMKDYDTDARANGITDGIVTLGDPRHVDVTGDHAYVVVPANYAFKKDGKPVQETGSMFTLVLQKGAADWRVTGWAWAKN
jgi:ketosteroid isomerase-like protein